MYNLFCVAVIWEKCSWIRVDDDKFALLFQGAPVAVGMSIDVASIDMVSEVNMVSALTFPSALLAAGSLRLVIHDFRGSTLVIHRGLTSDIQRIN